MKKKGITFNYCAESEAKEFLKKNNNYFRVSAYRKMYDHYPSGENKGKYRDLDFQYLRELSTIDMHLRFLIIKMCLDIEHYLKIDLLAKAESVNDDGYESIDKFFSDSKYQYIKKNIYYKRNATYCGDLINYCFEFDDDNETISNYSKCRLWDFLECITFGDFLKFYEYYHKEHNIENKYEKLIPSIKSLRNACAHNNCILSQLRKSDCMPNKQISNFISGIYGISPSVRRLRLKSRVIYEIVCLIYVYKELTPETIKKHRFRELNSFVNGRMVKNKQYFENQQIIKSSYSFFKKIIDNI